MAYANRKSEEEVELQPIPESESTSLAFIARQPIFGRNLNTFGYELLFRSGWDNRFDFENNDPDLASRQLLNQSLLTFGLHELVEDKWAFFNFTQEALEYGLAEKLPKGKVVIEILETAYLSPAMKVALESLREKGYKIALDDVASFEAAEPFLDYIDLVKLDVLDVPDRKTLSNLARLFKERGVEILAEKVEDHDMERACMRMGFDYFQGYFYSKPKVIAQADPSSSKLSALELIQEANALEPDLDRLELSVKKDLGMTYKLLKFINSSFFGFSHEIDSIRQAIVLLGHSEFRKWVSIMAMSKLNDDKAPELFRMALFRARYCELLAEAFGMPSESDSLFLTGLFSVMDALLDRPLTDALRELPLSAAQRNALETLGGSHAGPLLTVLAHESGDWEALQHHTAPLKLDPDLLRTVYANALLWSGKLSF